MTKKQLERKVKYWQKILKLENWIITYGLVKAQETDNRMGLSQPQPEYLRSNIDIQNPDHYYDTKGYFERGDFDRIIIHELLHCHFGLLYDRASKIEKLEIERTITVLERVIYDLWAGG